ncbi:hypothetical protein MLD38_035777 [Melastoma candidum]|uniref:Uncharacterized protein n=1 Tax=Melastoma candidum TaxID=119954 RepID=A0ACB9LH52_9MYRT|nr:hypothetical protein MLD38_035777 [Melastoma candidum]
MREIGKCGCVCLLGSTLVWDLAPHLKKIKSMVGVFSTCILGEGAFPKPVFCLTLESSCWRKDGSSRLVVMVQTPLERILKTHPPRKTKRIGKFGIGLLNLDR